MSTHQNQEDEIEIGKLFQLMGNGFTKLFNLIGNLLKAILKAVIFILLFVRKHLLKFAVSALIGFFLGYFSEGKERTYEGTMIVTTNFNSIYQLYNNIGYYNNLVLQKDTTDLAKLFNISKETAGSLKGFRVEPIVTENEKLSLLDKFVKTADTTTVKLIDKNIYLSSLTKFNYKNHKITAIATQNNIFRKLEPAIVANISENIFFTTQKSTFDKNIAFESRGLMTQLVQIDSLRNLYKRVMLKEAAKKSTGTQIDLSSKVSKKDNEIELFEVQKDINTRLNEINTLKAEKGEILNVVSGFGIVGRKVSIAYRAPGEYAILLMALTLITILLLELNRYLKNYKQNKF